MKITGTVLVTGASAGIGEACARAFAAAGARLVLTARREDRLRALADELRVEHGTESHLVTLDMRDREAVLSMLSSLPGEFGAVDVLVNNAGLGRGLDKVQTGDVDGWDEMVDTNVKGLLYATRAVTPGMVERGRGHVINIGSVAGHEVYPGGAVYCATKHAVGAITRGLRMDLLGTGVRVSTVDPGMVETEFSVVRFAGDRERADAVYRGLTPLVAADIADAVLWVASRPAHVNIDEIIIKPTDQASATLVNRS
ncbi:SDR family NAD(P)-dependent oxidoreductase [Longimicrobium terrae]|uniref:NADP-dependent 3-hydroxy acid dehydrogenase YdfG n=1 Tax=Longimicrobium terrae TaxID=1639882 RepID=A0A841GY61_9BACT|nr:SDR family NAD(P)-dependent oxidoreductase [Longimicrobium terrae]MBB4636287.1 NADP-dependent 3-hydroxy acid dehydrogenase YdfG [Longimicrobium terrae]MBB6070683.1 NADP-dependent 3-hydroxy acid dehydrogenase YdfG [Longimicrobium terrae]NNC29665.1 SDR family NAD(P)-dependent oxidoreductase [Longimicrobium terrae]